MRNPIYMENLDSFTSSLPTQAARMGDFHLQHTVGQSFSCTGIGVHSGLSVKMTISSGAVNHGIVFIRTDLPTDNVVSANWHAVANTALCTQIANAAGVTVSTIEHIMAAFYGCGIDNAVVELSGPEVPIMDGSSQHFVDLIREAGVEAQPSLLGYTRILKTVEVRHGEAYARLSPSRQPRYQMTFDGNGRLPQYRRVFTYYPNQDDFEDSLASARTFGFFEDAERLWAQGLARGASLENTIVLQGDGKVMNEDGLRFQDEFTRHKVLDALGDMALARGRLWGAYKGYNAGHKLNNLLLRELYADATAWCFESAAEITPLKPKVTFPKSTHLATYQAIQKV